MRRITRSVFGSLIIAACLLPAAGAAQAEQALPVAPFVTVDQARAAFSAAGFTVDRTYQWDWTSPPVTTFQVKDSKDRVLMVVVYPSATAAEAGRLQAESREVATGSASGTSAGGPHVVLGFGPSVWTGNVALVETTVAEQARESQAQADCDNGAYTHTAAADDPDRPAIAVDLDFQQALQSGAVNL